MVSVAVVWEHLYEKNVSTKKIVLTLSVRTIVFPGVFNILR